MLPVDLLIFDDYRGGGVQRSAMAARKVLAESGHECTILTFRAHSEGLGSDHSFVRCLVPNPPSGRIAYWFATLRALRARMKARGGVFAGFNVTANLAISIASAGVRNLRLVGSERVFPPAEPPARLVSALRRLLYRRLDIIVSQTERTRDWFHDVIGIRREKLVVIPNILRSPQREFMWRPRETASPGVIACVGRFVPQKGFDYALEILADCVAHGCSPQLLFVGDAEGESRIRLERRAEELGVPGIVEFRSRMDPLAPLWPSVDMLLFPSRFEGFPNVLAEAMSYGVPVVSFDCPTGPAELIEDGVNGFLVPLGDIQQAADRVRQLIANPELGAKLGKAAAETAERYSEDSVGKLWRSLVRQLEIH